MIKIGYDRALYLGGIAVLPNRHVLQFHFTNKDRGISTMWTEYFPRPDLKYASREQEEQFAELERQGHQAFYFNERIYIFAGGKGKQTGMYARDLTNDIVIYDFRTQELQKY